MNTAAYCCSFVSARLVIVFQLGGGGGGGGGDKAEM